MPYLLDANIFIEAKNRYYGFDFCPAFWDWLLAANSRGIIYSIENVQKELTDGNDELADWAAARGPDFFLKPDERISSYFSIVSNWVMNKNYERASASSFLNSTDYYLIIYSLAFRYTLVTIEVPSNSLTKIKIPNACIDLKIPYTSPFEMLRQEKARFVLER